MSNQVHRARKILLGARIGLIEVFEVREGRALRGHDMEGCEDWRGLFFGGRWRWGG
jgi:hypothetical protein